MKTDTLPGNEMISAAPSLPVPLSIGKGNRNLAFAFSFLSTLFAGILSMLMSVFLPDVVRDLMGNVDAEKMNKVSAFINSLFIFGWMFGGFSWGFVCDRIGRSRSVILSTFFFGLFGILTAVASNWMVVSIARFFSGFGIGGVLVTTTILISEIWPDKKRAIALGILSVAMPVGFFVAGAINNLLPSWREAFWISVIPFILAILSGFILQDSPAWQASRQNNPADRMGIKLWGNDQKKDLFSGAIIFGTMLIGLWAIFSWTPTWIQSISNGDAQQQRGSTMMILALGGLSGSFLSGWIANAIGLRKTMLLCFAVCFAFSFLVFKLSHSVSLLTYIELSVLAFFFGISQGALSVYIPLLFPTRIRAAATGFCFNIGRLFTATVVFFIGALVTLLGGYGNAIFIFSFIFLIGFGATWFAKEKKESIE